MSACTQPGCTGKIEDGYCDVCGMAGPSTPARGGTTASTRTGSGRAPLSRSTRSSRSGSARSGGAGARVLAGRPLARPPLPPLDPLAAVVPGVVPDRKRYCSGCDTPLKRDAGFCPRCGQEYSFIPTLSPGDIVAGKYEIKGTLAFGGLGWIYLALDTVLTRWVTLKGLLNAKDPRMLEVAVAEREYLAAIKHPNIVGIYDFITHGDQGYIVMEYVNGKTLMTLRRERGGPLPVAEAISYIAEVLPAFQVLDGMGLVYCDFKPENAMVEEETVKLIDLGAVRRADDTGGDVYGSKGYAAPEASECPSALSDLYSVGRTLAVLVANFDFQGRWEHSLPPRAEVPVFAEHVQLHRFLQKATRQKPEERFQSAAEMAEQLLGVLRVVVGAAADLGPAESSLFAPEGDRGPDPALSSGPDADDLPRLEVDPEDVAASVVLGAAALPDAERRLAMFQRLGKQHPGSLEVRIRILEELLSLKQLRAAEAALAEAEAAWPGDVRIAWVRGRALMMAGKTREALAAFEALAGELPGERAPELALGIAHELAGDPEQAIRCYDAVSRADGTFTSAAFRLARCLERRGDRAGAVAAYRRVPSTSSRHPHAQMAIARLLVTPPRGRASPALDELMVASAALRSLDGRMDGIEVRLLEADLCAAAALAVRSVAAPPVDLEILGVPLDERALREAAEAAYRAAARQARTDEQRWALVDRANEVRPVTWI